ncbi:hypothetical protein BCON_0110g00070 [Botryotinia convoluta]|uniref:Uncharacterized protein n=1 Tax=Botryotinia convoluta TaxID=54673 RepID=A0A4Z1HYD3_9HELO|nr:hypothetical protein BCON_0110g00070 [Botryotinia convoluta]
MKTAEVQEYLIVGITFLNLPAAIEKKCPTVKKRGVVGTKAEDGNKVDLDESIAPYLVVTPELSDDGKDGSNRTNLYALIVEKPAPNGLCLPAIVSQSKVFYLARYRDGSTTRNGRAAGWNKLAAKEAVLNAPPAALSTKQVRYGKCRDTTNIVLEPVLSLKNSIAFHLTSYLRTFETWHLQKVLSIMEQADEDLKHMPAPSNTALKAFLDNEEEGFGEDDAETMNKEMAELWPGFEKISTSGLLALKKQIMEADLFIEYRLLRPFLAEAAYLLKTIGEDQDQSGIARTALKTVTRVMMSNESIVPKEIPREIELLSAIKKVLKNARESSKAFDESMRDLYGDQVDIISPQAIWEKFSAATDVDSAKAAWMENARNLAVASRNRERGVGILVDDLIESLEHLGLKD